MTSDMHHTIELRVMTALKRVTQIAGNGHCIKVKPNIGMLGRELLLMS